MKITKKRNGITCLPFLFSEIFVAAWLLKSGVAKQGAQKGAKKGPKKTLNNSLDIVASKVGVKGAAIEKAWQNNVRLQIHVPAISRTISTFKAFRPSQGFRDSKENIERTL